MTVAIAGTGIWVAGAVHVRMPLRRPLVTARGAWSACDAWLVRLVDAAGRAGLGEATLGPFADPADQAGLDALVRSMVGRPAEVIRAGEGDAEGGEAGPSAFAARAAIDGALLDLGRVLADRSRASTIAVNALVGAESLPAATAAARDAVAAGFRTVKLKAGSERSTDELVDRLLAVRAVVGPDVVLRLDSNGAWDPATASDRLRGIAASGAMLAYVEQPLAAGSVAMTAASLARLRLDGGGLVPIAADESVTSQAAARALIGADAVDVLVIKPARVGGPRAALSIAADAAAAGVGVTISTLLETGVGLLVAMATAGMLPGDSIGAAHGVGTGALLDDDLVGGRSVVAGGTATVPWGPGLGLADLLDAGAVDRVALEAVGAWR